MDEADVQQFVFIRTVTRIPKEIQYERIRGGDLAEMSHA